MNSIERRGAVSAGPVSDLLSSIPQGATVIAAAGCRSHNYTKIEMVYSHNGSIHHISFTREGGAL